MVARAASRDTTGAVLCEATGQPPGDQVGCLLLSSVLILGLGG